MSPRILVVTNLTIIFLSDVFADKNHVTPKLSLINVPAFNYLLRSEVFVSEDGQLRVAPMILDYEPISRIFQDVGQALRAGNPKLAQVDISKPEFLAQRDLPPVILPVRPIPLEVAAPREETTSTHLSLEAEIDQFHLDEEGEAPDRPVEVSDSEAGFDRSFVANFPRLVVAWIDISEEEEEEDMALNQRRSFGQEEQGVVFKGSHQIPGSSHSPFSSPFASHWPWIECHKRLKE